MSRRLAGRVAVVTGGSRGAGRAMVERLRLDGAQVVSVSRTTAGDQADGGLLHVAADISTSSGANSVCQTALRRFGRLDVLVNNAAVISSGTIEETDPDDWDQVMAVNARGPYLCAKYAVPLMRQSGGGSIINVSSINANWAQPRLAAYCASKGALLALTRAIAIDHAHEGIRCNCVCPSYIRTEMLDQYYDSQSDPAHARHAAGAMHPIGRIAEPNEIAALVAWLASDDASYVTGHPFWIDGGLLAGQARTPS